MQSPSDAPVPNADKTEIEAQVKMIFRRAISSAEKHNVRLEPGKENHGDGNCSYESVIFNINERNCFNIKFNMSLEHYRVVWNTDMMNKILDKRVPWWVPRGLFLGSLGVL